jgi:hypothetical protein
MIYGSSTLERILSQVRPKDVPREKPVCRWLHIHENNMTWVEDLFTKLGYGGSIWAGRGHTSTAPQSRAITPHVALVTTSGDHNHGQGLFAAFAPYLSYEVNKRQLEISKFVQEKQSNYLKDVFESNFKDIWREIKKESPTNKVNQDEDALDSIDKHERHSESDSDRNYEGGSKLDVDVLPRSAAPQ